MDPNRIPKLDVILDPIEWRNICLNRLRRVVSVEKRSSVDLTLSDPRHRLIALAMDALYQDCVTSGVGQAAQAQLVRSLGAELWPD